MRKKNESLEEEEFAEDEFEIESGKKLSDWVRKAINTGVGAVFSTEEGIRNVLSEMKLSKEMISSIANGVDKTKKEIVQVVGREIREFLDTVEIHDLIKKSLLGTTFEISAKIRVVPTVKNQIGFSRVGESDRKAKNKTTPKRSGSGVNKKRAKVGVAPKGKGFQRKKK